MQVISCVANLTTVQRLWVLEWHTAGICVAKGKHHKWIETVDTVDQLGWTFPLTQQSIRYTWIANKISAMYIIYSQYVKVLLKHNENYVLQFDDYMKKFFKSKTPKWY